MAARALKTNTMDHIPLAGSIECLHTATLFHDDVVDNSEARRGQPSANTAFGNAASVLVGDFVYSRAFQMMVSVGRLDILKLLADTTNQISEGEVWQLKNQHRADISESDMTKLSHGKQRRCLRPPQPVRDLSPINLDEVVEALKIYGLQLGFAFQLIDDYLDYAGNTNASEKILGTILLMESVPYP